MIYWDSCKDYFQWDGSLRDIYVAPATLNDWRVIYPLLLNSPGILYSEDGVKQPAPALVESVFAVRASASPMLQIMVGEASLVFHFFSVEEIECDFDPREIASQSDLDALLSFVQMLGESISKQVVITEENDHEAPFISYLPYAGVFQYHERKN
jgi:hypothetical protein